MSQVLMRRASEGIYFSLGFPRKKKHLHNGSYQHRVWKKKKNLLYQVCVCDCTCDYVCVIQHRNWPYRSTILNPHGTNASPDGLCTRIHTNEAFSCWFCCDSFRVNQARRGNVCLEYQGKACSLTDQPVRKFKDGLGCLLYTSDAADE